MVGLDSRLFQYFIAVAEERHFGRAAARLGIAPPTLTHQIQKLEREVGVQLLLRGAHSAFSLTEAGKRFLDRSRIALREAEGAVMAARHAARGESGTLAIGYMTVVACSGLLKYVAEFQNSNPQVDIQLYNRTTMRQVESILGRDIDVGFTRPPKQYPAGLKGFLFFQQPMIVAIPADHPLAEKRGAIPLDALRTQTFVNTSLEAELGFQRQTVDLAKFAGFAPSVVKRVPEMLSVLAYVSAGYGIAICSEALSRIALPNIVYRPLAGTDLPRSSIAFVYRRDETSPVARRFIEQMRTHAATHQKNERASA